MSCMLCALLVGHADTVIACSACIVCSLILKISQWQESMVMVSSLTLQPHCSVSVCMCACVCVQFSELSCQSCAKCYTAFAFTWNGGVCPASLAVRRASGGSCRSLSETSCYSPPAPRRSPMRCHRRQSARWAWGQCAQTGCRETRHGSPTAAGPPAACRCSCTRSIQCRRCGL